ncbi:hypothetical protein KUTeg_020853 [Tegillarca granosa]|uniref:C-type lectin domain-containing protein n=1 Tax=Tegillarca granosa TaxID=220873 RepID=A0ABQ9E939_TEGGR|nr:hypothetical protein KUTeg_020853 [Tegillarca granosa]
MGYWIGGSDMEVEGNWIWIKSRQRFTFTDWGAGQPTNSYNHEDCLHLYGKLDFHWNDEACSHSAYFICEKPII